MNGNTIRVTMLDRFSVVYRDKKIEDSSKRAKKVWLLLAYLLCNRGKIVSKGELFERIWGGNMGENPEGTLKTTMWRVRQLLEQLDPSFGHSLVQNKNGGYCWNREIPVEADFEQFERLCRAADFETDDAARRDSLRAALELYRSDFLERYSAETWVSPLTAYYNNLYVNAAIKQLGLLQEHVYAEAAEQLCRAVIRVSPYHEEIYQYLMRSLMELHQYEKADAVYAELRERLFENLGVLPARESQELHAEVVRHMNRRVLSADDLHAQLQETDPAPGPLFCEYPVFQQFYQGEARSAARRGDAIHVGLLTVSVEGNRETTQYVLEQAMDKLHCQIAGQLRQGDVVSRCSAAQFVILLQANYENSNMVCERIIRAYERSNPYSPARIAHSILSLEPLVRKPSVPASGWKKTS